MDNKIKIQNIFDISIIVVVIIAVIIVIYLFLSKSNYIKITDAFYQKKCMTSLDCDDKSICIKNKCHQIKFDEITTNVENNMINGKFGFFKKYFKNTI